MTETHVVTVKIALDDDGDVFTVSFANGRNLSPAEAGLILIDAARAMIALAAEADQETEH